jgi:hypothetical protein
VLSLATTDTIAKISPHGIFPLRSIEMINEAPAWAALRLSFILSALNPVGVSIQPSTKGGTIHVAFSAMVALRSRDRTQHARGRRFCASSGRTTNG